MIWNKDFTYRYYLQLLNAIKNKGFTLCTISDYVYGQSKNKELKAIVRHDIDVSLKKALEMSLIEKRNGIHATYMIMQNSPLYALDDPESQHIIQTIKRNGHEIGLHFNIKDEMRTENLSVSEIKLDIEEAGRLLEYIIGQKIESISFHRPLSQLINGPLFINNLINAYANELMQGYISDSKGNFRDGDPLLQIMEFKGVMIQLLTHPIWWGDQHLIAEDRLEDFYKNEVANRPLEYTAMFSDSLSRSLPAVQRSGMK